MPIEFFIFTVILFVFVGVYLAASEIQHNKEIFILDTTNFVMKSLVNPFI